MTGHQEPTMKPSITPFRIDIPESALTDLRRRLSATRWPDAQTVDDWSQGMPLAYTQELCAYWRDRYDWRAREALLNRFVQFRTEVDGLGIHFIHVRSVHAQARPLLMTHGWPGSVAEFQKVIAPLTDPTADGGSAEDAFHLVCPSLPGFGFSDKPTRTGWGVERIAGTWNQLMGQLGYEHYFAQGGDWGASVSTMIGMRHAGPCAGIHITMPMVAPDKATMNELSGREQQALAALQYYRDWDAGYSTQQGTRPQTLAYGLADSPAGQAAWIVEKFCAWMDCDGHPENVLTRDELLDNVMLYWLTNSAASSARLYWESFNKRSSEAVKLPSGISMFPKEIFGASRRWAEKRFTDLRHWSEPSRGGHFAALEQPQVLVREIRACFNAMR
jgi:pimeloyl-ACP methyl ester carboxylesterase